MMRKNIKRISLLKTESEILSLQKFSQLFLLIYYMYLFSSKSNLSWFRMDNDPECNITV